jgi:hypothetical protein
MRQCRAVVQILPQTDRETHRAERRRLGNDRTDDGDAEHVGLELHQHIVDGRAAVDLEHVERDAGVQTMASSTARVWKRIDSRVAR